MSKKQSSAFIDTNILIWAIRGEATQGQEAQVLKSQNLIDWLNDNSTRIMTSSICLGEFLTGVNVSKHTALTNVIKRSFMLYTYDDACALKAAWLWKKRKENIKELRNKASENGHRAKIINDVMIVATALVQGADVIYTNDTDIKSIAGDLIKVELLDNYDLQLSKQEDMFPKESRVVH